jgi:hypothetical protein
MLAPLWIITAYFNPCRYVRKKQNFDLFCAGMNSIGANLLVIELALEDGAFELGDEHNVLRMRGNGLMWQKERLLNLANAHLPASCSKVAWLDCDLLFENSAWLRETSAALERHVVVQPFSQCLHLPRGCSDLGGAVEAEQTTESFAAAFARDPSLARDQRFRRHGHTGFAWAARRELFDACGLYDACLTGSGDHLMAHAFAGTLSSQCIPTMIGDGDHAKHFARWAAEADHIVGGSLGHVPGRVLHLWHGTIADRRYHDRNQEFKTFAFDPVRHIRRDENDLWDWADAPAGLQAWAMDMLVSRNEDGNRGTGSNGG